MSIVVLALINIASLFILKVGTDFQSQDLKEIYAMIMIGFADMILIVAIIGQTVINKMGKTL